MKYQGSKNRLAKEILPIILKDRKEGQASDDLFCGGANVCDKVDGKVVANDCHYYTIKALEFIRDHLNDLPKCKDDTNETKYKEIKQQNPKDDCSAGLKGYYGFALSYSGKWFGGWCRDSTGKRDYIAEAYRNAQKQSPRIKHITFTNLSYDEVPLLQNSILYLDPPYKGTTKYKTGDFDYDKFYAWCVDKNNEGHQVFISEYYMPEDRFECVWQKEVNSSLTKDTGSKKNTEKLWVVKTK